MELLFVLTPVIAAVGVLGVYGTVCAMFLLELRRLGQVDRDDTAPERRSAAGERAP